MNLISPTTLGIGAIVVGTAAAWPSARALVHATAIDDIAGDRTSTVASTETHEYRLSRSPMSSQLTYALGGGGLVLGGIALGVLADSEEAPGILSKLHGNAKGLVLGGIAGLGAGALAGAVHGYAVMEGVQPHRKR